MRKKSYDVSQEGTESKRETDGLSVIPQGPRTYGTTRASSG